MNDLSVERTPQVIAVEINMIAHQTNKILLTSAIESGRRLKDHRPLRPTASVGAQYRLK